MLKELLKIFCKPSDDKGEDLPVLTLTEMTEIAQHGDAEKCAQVAAREDTQPELLYFLADDDDDDDDNEAAVRRKITANPNTPRQADRLLAEDHDGDVRCELAVKIARLVPGLSAGESEALQDLTFEILDVLAQDQLPRVREIVAEELKFAADAPLVLIRRLVIDLDFIVSAPILEYSSMLTDKELLEIILANPIEGALSAIARREEVSAQVSDAIILAGDDPAVAELLANPSSQIREDTLDQIIDRAPEVPPWHEPLVQRPRLSQDAIRRIASFVSSSLLATLVEQSDLDEETARSFRKRAAPVGENRRRPGFGRATARRNAVRSWSSGRRSYCLPQRRRVSECSLSRHFAYSLNARPTSFVGCSILEPARRSRHCVGRPIFRCSPRQRCRATSQRFPNKRVSSVATETAIR